MKILDIKAANTYHPCRKSDSGASKPKKPAVAEEPDDDEDADPLDAFMMGVEETVRCQHTALIVTLALYLYTCSS